MLARIDRAGDVLAHEGGLVRSETPIAHSLFLPQGIRARAREIVSGLLLQQALAPDQIMGCVLRAARAPPPIRARVTRRRMAHGGTAPPLPLVECWGSS